MLMTVTMINEWQLYVFNKGGDDDDGSGGRRSAVETVRQQKEREGGEGPKGAAVVMGLVVIVEKWKAHLLTIVYIPPHFVGIC